MKKTAIAILLILSITTLVSCGKKTSINITSINDKLIKLVDEYTNNKYEDYTTKNIKIYSNNDNKFIFSYEAKQDIQPNRIYTADAKTVVLSYIVDNYNFPYFCFLPSGMLDAYQLWFYYEDEIVYDLKEAYDQKLITKNYLYYTLENYLISLNHTQEEIQLFVRSTENILNQKKIIEEKLSNSFSKVIKDYDNNYKLNYLGSDEIRPVTDDYVARFFNYYPIYKRFEVYKNEEQIGRIIITSGFNKNPSFRKVDLYEKPLYIMVYISNDDEIKGLYVIDHNIDNYPYDENYDFELIGKTKNDFIEKTIERSNIEYDNNYFELYQELYLSIRSAFGGLSTYSAIPEF